MSDPRNKEGLKARFNEEITRPIGEEVAALIASKKMSYSDACEALEIAQEEIKHFSLTSEKYKVLSHEKVLEYITERLTKTI